MAWGSPVEIERHRRIKLSVAAFGYERMSVSLMTDHEFDAECLKVDLSIDTGNAKLDAWWRENFHPCTGSWINRHPHQKRLEQLVNFILTERELRGALAQARIDLGLPPDPPDEEPALLEEFATPSSDLSC